MAVKTFSFHGFTGTLKELASHFGINYTTLQTRLKHGMSLDEALSIPVDKSRGHQTPKTVLEIGNFRGTADSVYNWFGLPTTCSKGVAKSDVMTKYVRTWKRPHFYSVGENYKGSLIAISVDFGCPLSALQIAVKSGKTPEQFLKEKGLIK